MKEYIERGKADVFISFYNASGETECVHYNKSIAAEYLSFLREMLSDSSIDDSRIVTEVTIFSDKVCVDEEWLRRQSRRYCR